jgi:AbrB family looped-hinge helix DNA binding protein
MRSPSTTIDGFGRVVIPKAARDRYGLLPGTVVELEESPPGILLRPAPTEATVRSKGGILVLTSRAASSLEDAVRADRTARSRHLGLGGRR